MSYMYMYMSNMAVSSRVSDSVRQHPPRCVNEESKRPYEIPKQLQFCRCLRVTITSIKCRALAAKCSCGLRLKIKSRERESSETHMASRGATTAKSPITRNLKMMTLHRLIRCFFFARALGCKTCHCLLSAREQNSRRSLKISR